MYMCNIPDLSEHFIHINDDMYPCKPMKESDFFDENGFKEIEYRKDSSSGDLRIEKLVFSDGTSLND